MKASGRRKSANKNGKSYNGKLLLYTNNHIILINCSTKFLRFTSLPFQHHPHRRAILFICARPFRVRVSVSFFCSSFFFFFFFVVALFFSAFTHSISLNFASLVRSEHTQRENLCEMKNTIRMISFLFFFFFGSLLLLTMPAIVIFIANSIYYCYYSEVCITCV